MIFSECRPAGEQCVFPFRVGAMVCPGPKCCTDKEMSGGTSTWRWCSTKTDSLGFHIGGNYKGCQDYTCDTTGGLAILFCFKNHSVRDRNFLNKSTSFQDVFLHIIFQLTLFPSNFEFPLPLISATPWLKIIYFA